MSEKLPAIYLARHGETAWSLSGQDTGLTDLPLTERGERNAHQLGERLQGLTFVSVFTSPLQRTARTCELAGFAKAAEIDRNLLEWNYGEYEGRRTSEIHAERPDWRLFRDGCRGGESPNEVGARAQRVNKCGDTEDRSSKTSSPQIRSLSAATCRRFRGYDSNKERRQVTAQRPQVAALPSISTLSAR